MNVFIRKLYDRYLKPYYQKFRMIVRKSNERKRKKHLDALLVDKGLHLTNRCVVCNNCVGSMMQHDIHQQFLSPTVNLYFPSKDYIQFLKLLPNLRNAIIEEVPSEFPYPKGLINGKIRVYFMHYSSFEEALEAWNKRLGRIDFNNLLVLFVEGLDCTENDLLEFDKMPFSRKFAITHKHYDCIESQVVVKGFEKSLSFGILTDFEGLNGKRKYDRINWLSFFEE